MKGSFFRSCKQDTITILSMYVNGMICRSICIDTGSRFARIQYDVDLQVLVINWFFSLNVMHLFEHFQTYVGDILIALNPFKSLGIYHKNVSLKYLVWYLKLFKVCLYQLYTCSLTSVYVASHCQLIRIFKPRFYAFEAFWESFNCVVSTI